MAEKDKRRERWKKWYANNKDKKLEYGKKYYKSNSDREKTRHIKYLADPDKRIRALYIYARRRARDKELQFTITENDLHYIYMEQSGFCPVSGIRLNFDTNGKGKAVLDGVSLDRINPSIGYTKKNIRLVCWAVNAMKYSMTDAEFFSWVERIHLTNALKTQIIDS